MYSSYQSAPQQQYYQPQQQSYYPQQYQQPVAPPPPQSYYPQQQQQQQSPSSYYPQQNRYQDIPKSKIGQGGGGNVGGGGGINSQQQQGGPLEKKVMVLYVLPGEEVSTRAWQMVVDYPEILVQDARQIVPRPDWLKGIPTLVMVNTKAVHAGPRAFQEIMAYIQNLKVMSGAQSEMVVPTVDPNSGFSVAAKDFHYKACADEKRSAEVPVGTTTRTAMTVGQVNFAQEDDARYYATTKVSENDLNQYITMREQKRQPQVQLRPSVLENGDMVTM